MPDPSAEQLANAVYFWNADQPHGQFSQWYPKPFTVHDKTYPAAEHYMMCAKARLFGDTETEDKIRHETSPEKVRDLGRQITPFDSELWNKHKFEIVCDGNRAKFRDAEMSRIMLDTADRLMVEASPLDRIWGIGYEASEAAEHVKEWGENLMGQVMMTVRSELQKTL